MSVKNSFGPAPRHKQYHILKALLVLRALGKIGRGKLADELGLGEGSTRTVVEWLRKTGMIKIGQTGILLSEKGARAVERFVGPVVVRAGGLSVGKHDCAVLVKGGASGVKLGIEQRDAAIRIGAAGATTVVAKNGKLALPGESKGSDIDIAQNYASIAGELFEKMAPIDGDAIIIGSAGEPCLAADGAIEAARQLAERLI